MKTMYKKIANVKAHIGKITKDSTNPFFKSKYFDINSLLEQLEPLLEAEGLLLLQPIQDGKLYTNIIDIDSGEMLSSNIDLLTINDPQKLGSCITYYRRYAIQAFFSLQAEDDDGNAAAKKPRPELVINTEAFKKAKKWIKDGGNIELIKKKYTIRESTLKALTDGK